MSLHRAKPWLLAIGVGFLLYAMYAGGGPKQMIMAVARIGWWFVPAFLATAAAHWLRTLAWRTVFEDHTDRPPMAALWRARLIGESLNYLTFAGPLLGDPARASELKSETGCRSSLASVGVDRFLYALASIIFIALAGFVWLGKFGLLGGLLCIAFIWWSPALALRFGYTLSRRTSTIAVSLHLLSHLCMAVEAAILLKGLGFDVDLFQSSAVEAMAKGVGGIFFFLPMQIGVAEAGNALLLQGMNIGASVGLALGLARRVRSLAWAAAGLALMT